MLSDPQARYRLIVEAQAEFISLARPDGTLVYVNEAYARHFGVAPAALVGSNLYDLVPEAERDVLRAHLDAVFAGGRIGRNENRLVCSDGSERWYAWTNRPHLETDGEPLLHSVGRDVTERKRMEEALRESRSFLDRTGRIAGVGGWQLEIATRHLIWSEQTRRIHEVPPDYQPSFEAAIAYYVPEARPVIEAAVRAAIDKGTPWDLELPFVTATGRSIWVRAQGEAERENGVPVRLVGAFQDVTERKRMENQLRELTAILDHSPDYIQQTDAAGRITWMNRAARAAIGLAADVPLPPGLDFGAYMTPETQARFAGTIVPALRQHGVWLGDNTVYAADRRELPVSHLVLAHRDSNGRIARYSGVMRDISARLAAQRELMQRTEMLRSITEAVPAAIAVLDTGLRYRFVNSAFERWLGTPRERVIGRPVLEVLGRVEAEHIEPWARRALAGETVNFEREYAERGAMRHVAASYMPLWGDGGGVDGFVAMLNDITAHRREEDRLLELAHRDTLTGLANRAGFERELTRRIEAGDGASLALLYVDLDRFKPVNDDHGHAVGDDVLRHFAQRLRGLVRAKDAVARLGGDEFVVLLAGAAAAGAAERVAAKIIDAAGQPFHTGALRLAIGASVGVAVGACGANAAADLLARADAMLYRAKQAGRGRVAA